jgi:integrase
MASLNKRSDGTYFVEFILRDERKTISVGRAPKTVRETVKSWIERLVAAVNLGTSPDAETCSWLAKIDDKLAARLAKVGLTEPRKPQEPTVVATLENFLSDYLAQRTDIKPSTRTNLEVARRNLVAYFGADAPLSAVTAGDADAWRLWLKRSKRAKPDEPMPPGFADNTARRCCGRAKQFFKAAKKRRLVSENPFEEIGDCQVRANKTRDRFVTPDEAQKVLDACPNAQWRLLFALSRFGGLRCPSEHAALRWADIDWKNNRFTVHSCKTEHHEGHESRVVPIFAELRPYLEAAWNESPKDAEFVITIRTMRARKANPRTTMTKIVKAAGLKPWPKLFHNLRASRQTELEGQGFPQHVVCGWLGNSPKVAREHYLRATDDDFQKASGQPTRSAGQGAGQKAQDRAQDHAPPQAATLRKTIANVLKENGLDAKPGVISQLAEISKSSPGRTRTYDPAVNS